ncbi:MAG: hypothetical protein WD055_02845 [Candidatus Dependentiae bacterium]
MREKMREKKKQKILIALCAISLSHYILGNIPVPTQQRMWQNIIDDLLLDMTIDSKVDQIQLTANTIESKVCTIDSKVDAIQSTLNSIDFDGSVIDQVDSKLCALDMLIRGTEDSKLDVIIDLDENTLSKVCTIDSKVDVIDAEIEQVQSKVCAIDSKVDFIIQLLLI